jgi:hypothetical protein
MALITGNVTEPVSDVDNHGDGAVPADYSGSPASNLIILVMPKSDTVP